MIRKRSVRRHVIKVPLIGRLVITRARTGIVTKITTTISCRR